MSAKHLDRVVHRLQADRAFVEVFRRQPEAAMAPYRLTEDERAALISGDARQLLALGMRPSRLQGTAPAGPFAASILSRFGTRLSGPILAALLLAAGATYTQTHAKGARAASERAGARLIAVRASRFTGRRAARARVGARFTRKSGAPGLRRALGRLTPRGRATGLARAHARVLGPDVD